MLIVFEAMIPVALLIALGLHLRRSNILPEEQWTGAETLTYWVLFPALLFHSLYRVDLKSMPLGDMSFAMIGTILSMSLLLVLLRPLLKNWVSIDDPSFTSIFQSTIRWNAFIALGIVQKAYGPEAVALVAVAMAAMIPLINVFCVGVLAIYASQTKPNIGAVLLNIIKNPLILSCLAGLAFNLLNIPLWAPILSTFDILARASVALGLLVVGAGLRLRYAFPPSRDTWLSAGLRFIALPAMTLCFALPLGLDGMVLEVIIIAMCVPTAMSGFVLAKKMGGNAPLVAASVTLQAFLSILAIPFWLTMARLLMQV